MGRATLIAGAGAVCAALALVAAGAPIAGLPWTIAVALGCLGYGEAAMRGMRARGSTGLTAVVGLAIMLVAATVLARIGVLTRACQIALVALGLVAGVIARPEPRRLRALEIVAAIAGLACIALTLTQQVPIIDDGANHTLLVKGLADTGRLGLVHHQAGAYISGEALLSLATGAHSLTIFDEGLCVALLLLLLASELADGGDLGIAMFIVLALPIALHPMPDSGDTGPWAAVLFSVATYRALQNAYDARRTGWTVIPLALALAALRHEYAVLAVPYLAAALVLPVRTPSRRAQLTAIALWAGGLFAMQLAYRSTWPLALVRAGALLVVVPLSAVVARIAESARAAALPVLAFATLSMIGAVATGATSPSFHADIATTATWYGAALCLVMLASPQPTRLALATLGIIFVVGGTVFDANIADLTRAKVLTRWVDAAGKLDELRILGYRVEADAQIAALQTRVPRGARIAFWGQSGAALDFARNPIRDVSWQLGRWHTTDYLDEIDPLALRHMDFLIVERISGRARRDAWGAGHADPLADVRTMIDPVAATPRAQLFRLRR